MVGSHNYIGHNYNALRIDSWLGGLLMQNMGLFLRQVLQNPATRVHREQERFVAIPAGALQSCQGIAGTASIILLQGALQAWLLQHLRQSMTKKNHGIIFFLCVMATNGMQWLW